MNTYTDYKLRIFPINGDGTPCEIDRAQSVTPTTNLNRERKDELGRDGVVGYKKGIPQISYALTQLEYGSFEFWQRITNSEDAETSIDLNDFKTSKSDIVAYLTDDDGTFIGTMHYPKLRVSGFNFTIGTPTDDAQRSFNLVGEKAIQWQGDNKYYIFVRHEAGSGDDNEISLATRVPALLPDMDVSGYSDAKKYIYRVLRFRGTTTTELTVDTDYSYSDATKILTVTSVLTSDVIKVYYTSSTAPATLFTDNDSDPASIAGDSVVIEIGIGTHVYRLQSIDLGVTFDRTDEGEIGNPEKILNSIKSKTVSIKLGRFLDKDLTLEEALRDVVDGYGQIDFSKFVDSVTITAKIYEDNTQETFKCGFKATGLSSTEIADGASVQNITTRNFTFEGDSLTITNNINSL